jgi:hypothetical protein
MLSNQWLAILVLGPIILAVLCGYCWWQRLAFTRFLISIGIVCAAVVTGGLWVWRDTRGSTFDAVVGDTVFVTLTFAPPLLSAICIYYSWPRIARPAHYFFISVISLWAIGIAIVVFVVLTSIGIWHFPGNGAVPDSVLYTRLFAALVAFLAIVVMFLLLLLRLMQPRSSLGDHSGSPL